MMTEEEQQTEEERYDIPTAPYTVMLRNGRQVAITDLPDKILKRMAYKHMRALRKQLLNLAAVKAEVDERKLENFGTFTGYNFWQIVTHATLLSLNNYNQFYPDRPLIVDERPKKKEGEEE